MKGATGSVIFEAKRSVLRFILKIVGLFIVVMLLLTAFGAHVQSAHDTKKATAAHVQRNLPVAETPSPETPASRAVHTDAAHRLFGLLKTVALILILIVAIPVLAWIAFWAAILAAQAIGAASDYFYTSDFEQEKKQRDRLFRKQDREQARLKKDAEVLALRNEVARLQREGEAPQQRGSHVSVQDDVPEHWPHSTNGASPPSN